MSKKSYWVGKRPHDGKAWQYTTSATVLELDKYREPIFKAIVEYIRHWNLIEFDRTRELSDHIQLINGAEVIGSTFGRYRFIMVSRNTVDNWIVEVSFRRGFNPWSNGKSCGRPEPKSVDDISSICLHWSDGGRDAFDRWVGELETTGYK
jgi:hypothetical protein